MQAFLRTVLLLSIIIFSSDQLLRAQFESYTSVSNSRFLDVISDEGKSYYTNGFEIVEIDDLGNETIIESGLGSYLRGSFHDTENGWNLTTWAYLDIDVLLPYAAIIKWDGEQTTRTFLDLFDSDLGLMLKVLYQTDDEIFVLTKQNSKVRVSKVNSESEVLETHELINNTIDDMQFIGNGHFLLNGNQALYVFDGNDIIQSRGFSNEISSVKIDETNSTITALTQNEIHILDFDLNVQNTIALPVSDKNRIAIHPKEDEFYIIEYIDQVSYINTYDIIGNLISEYEEFPEIEYEDLYIEEDHFFVWGETRCVESDNLLKIDTIAFQSEVPTEDLVLTDLTFEYVKTTYDTVVVNGDDTIFYSEVHYDWELEVHNASDKVVEGYDVNSTFYGWNRLIKFNSTEALNPGESRIHTGDFTTSPIIDGLQVWVSGELIDADCSDNWIAKGFPTNVDDVEVLDVVIYPNPADDFISVKGLEEFSYRIFDLNGVLIDSGYDRSDRTIDTSRLKPGLYIIDFMKDGGHISKKFVKI